jgi:hypothetical protein
MSPVAARVIAGSSMPDDLSRRERKRAKQRSSRTALR